MAKKRANMDAIVAHNMRIAGEMAGKSMALAEEAALKGMKTAKKVSKTATNEFMKGFKKGHGKKKRIF